MYTLVSFDNCTLSGLRFAMYIYRNDYEPEISEQSFNFRNKEHTITISRSHIRAESHIHVVNSLREIRLVQSDLEYLLDINIGNEMSIKCNAFTLARVVVENSRVISQSGIDIFAYGPTSLGLIQFRNTDFQGSRVKMGQTGGSVGFHFESCTLRGIDWWGISLHNVLYLHIKSCQFKLKDDARCREGGGCSVNVKGLTHSSSGEPRDFESVAKSLFFPACNSSNWRHCRMVHIENSVFVGSAGAVGGAVNCQDIKLIMIKCEFSLTENSKPAATGAFLYYNSYKENIIGRNITFVTSGTQLIMPVSIIAKGIELINVHMKCPNSLSVVEETQDFGDYVHHYYQCNPYCDDDEYTYEAGSMILQGNSSSEQLGNLSLMATEPKCSTCPVGANCHKHIQALPNYWGYRNKSNRVTMIRCPNGYCCQDDKTCKGIDSCNNHRTGQLCGKCDSNWTESLFSPECLLVKYCPAAEVLFVYIACVIAYGLGLMAFNYIKDVGPSVLQKLFEAIGQILPCKKRQKHSPENSYELESLKPEDKSDPICISDKKQRSLQHTELTPKKLEKDSQVDKGKTNVDEEENDVLKYVQILFYYVQDATLFKVKLSSEDQQEESIVVKILQFSPEVLVTLYTHVIELCFSSGTTAVTKILFSSLFGPCVMIFIFLLYLIQKCLPQIIGKSRKMFRARLVQTFLLVVLFSYQQIVIGTFTSVQCVNIGNNTVLYVQGDIECYTWWQNAVEAYIVLSVVPVFCVLSHFPFYVEDKTMSVRMFITGCILPLPAMVVYHVQKFITEGMVGKFSRKSMQPVAETQFDTGSLSEHTVVSEQNQIKNHDTSGIDWNVKVDEFFLRMGTDDDMRRDISRDTLGQAPFESDADMDIGSEYSTDLIRVKNQKSNDSDKTITRRQKVSDVKAKEKNSKSKFNNSREAISHTLLKQYRHLNVFGVRFTWLGVHKLYRVGLVACNTYITDPMAKLCTMSLVLMVIAIVSIFTKPYKDRNTNRVAILSYIANICIAMINLIKVGLVTFGCQVNCGSKKDNVLGYLGNIENVLLIYVPCALFPGALVYMGLEKCMGKSIKDLLCQAVEKYRCKGKKE